MHLGSGLRGQLTMSHCECIYSGSFYSGHASECTFQAVCHWLAVIGTGGVSTLQQATAAGGPWMLLVPSCKQGACSSQLHSSHGLQALTQAAERVGLRPAQLLGGRFLVVCKGRHALA